jgi:putative addiction module killer protein
MPFWYALYVQKTETLAIQTAGSPVQEMRIFVGKGYRVYFTVRNNRIILLLNGGHKGTQQQDIAKAHELLGQLED